MDEIFEDWDKIAKDIAENPSEEIPKTISEQAVKCIELLKKDASNKPPTLVTEHPGNAGIIIERDILLEGEKYVCEVVISELFYAQKEVQVCFEVTVYKNSEATFMKEFNSNKFEEFSGYLLEHWK